MLEKFSCASVSDFVSCQHFLGYSNGNWCIPRCHGPDYRRIMYESRIPYFSHVQRQLNVTAYASIGSELNQLQNTSWIATAYMLTQTSFQCACLL